MVRGPYIDKNGLKKGAWSKEEDDKLRGYIQRYGHRNWRQLPKFAGLQRCGKSCRIRWLNYLRPDVKRGGYSEEEEDLIMNLYEKLGSKWSKIAEKLPGRTDNEIKNHWHTHLKKCQEQKQRTPDHESKEQTLEVFSQDDDVIGELEAEISTSAITCNNPCLPVILESYPFSPSSSSGESSCLSSNSPIVNVVSDGDEANKKGAWDQEEDDKLRAYFQRHGLSNGWSEVPKIAGLSRSSRSCFLRWKNYLRPEVKRGSYSKEEEDHLIIKLHEQLGNKRSAIAARLPGRTDNEIKNYWNIHHKKRMEFNEQPIREISRSDKASVNKEQTEDVNFVDQTTPSPLLEDIPLTTETPSSEFSFFSSEHDMVNSTMNPMDWFMEESSNPFEIFEADFWTEPFVLDTAGTHNCDCNVTSSMDWELSSTPVSIHGPGGILPYSL